MVNRPRAKITRRNFAGICVGAAAAGASALDSVSQVRGAQAVSTSTGSGAIDQNPIRRRGTGLRALDIARACPGLTLFSPLAGDGIVYLISLDGRLVHTWKMPYPPGLYGYLTENGTLFYNGKIPNDTFLGKAPFKGGAALEADWNGKVLWEVRHPNHHHDGRLLRNGNVLLLCATELPDDVAKKVQGDRSEWTHGNALMELPDGDLLVSFREISTIIKIERRTGRIVWKLGAPPLSGQHAPTPLPNGNILIFDNGAHRLDESFPFSRVIEVNPLTNDIVWKYQEEIFSNFFSPRISNAQRLPNGNTLINEGWFGRFFEVTSEGEVVWEYVNPDFGPASEAAKAQNNGVFRVYRYTEKEIARSRAAI